MLIEKKYDVLSYVEGGFPKKVAQSIAHLERELAEKGSRQVALDLNQRFPLQEFTSSEGRKIPFRENHPINAKVTMVMMPGTWEPTLYYSPYLRTFSDVHVIVPSFTESQDPEKYLEGVHELVVNKKQEGPVVVMGQSIGGVCAMRYNEKFPKEANGLILSHTATDDSPIFRLARFRSLQALNAIAPLATMQWDRIKEGIQKKGQKRYEPKDTITKNDPMLGLYGEFRKLYCEGKTMEEFSSKTANTYLEFALKATQPSRYLWMRRQRRNQVQDTEPIPTLIFQTKKDPVMPPWFNRLKEKYPHALVHTFTDSKYGHQTPYAFSQDIMCSLAMYLEEYFL